jgi:hypothetical protein
MKSVSATRKAVASHNSLYSYGWLWVCVEISDFLLQGVIGGTVGWGYIRSPLFRYHSTKKRRRLTLLARDIPPGRYFPVPTRVRKYDRKSGPIPDSPVPTRSRARVGPEWDSICYSPNPNSTTIEFLHRSNAESRKRVIC